jgi:hypothetical protein
VSFAVHHDLEALVIVVSAVRTNAHSTTLRSHSAKEDRNKSWRRLLPFRAPPSPTNRIAARSGPYETLAVDRDVHISGPGYANRLRHQRGRRPWYRTRLRRLPKRSGRLGSSGAQSGKTQKYRITNDLQA